MERTSTTQNFVEDHLMTIIHVVMYLTGMILWTDILIYTRKNNGKGAVQLAVNDHDTRNKIT